MGGERASTTRMRRSGKICCFCSSPLPPPYPERERVCDKCEASRKPRHRVYMHFMLRDGWHCQFLEADLKTPLPRKLTIRDTAKLFEMAERGGYKLNLEGRQAIEYGIQMGRGSIWLDLTPEQYGKLKNG